MASSNFHHDDDESARKLLYDEFDALDDYYKMKCMKLLTSQEGNVAHLTEDFQLDENYNPTAETFEQLTAELAAEFNAELAADFTAELNANGNFGYPAVTYISEFPKAFIVQPITEEITTSEFAKELIVEPITEEVVTTSEFTAELAAEFNAELAADFAAELNANGNFGYPAVTATSEFTKEFIVEPITEEVVTTSEFTKEFIVEPITEEVTTEVHRVTPTEFTMDFTEFIAEPVTKSSAQLDQRKSDSMIFERILDGVKETYASVNAKAIQNSETQRLMVEDIYEFYYEKFPQLRQLNCYWKNSVRHTLSLKNGNFIKYEVKSKYGNAKQKRYEYGIKPEGNKITKRNTGTKKVRRGKKENEAV